MPSTNFVIILGNVGKTVETRFTGRGVACTSFSIATNERWKDKESGEWKSRTDWHNVKAWGKWGEIAAEKVKAGDLVQVIGKSQTRSWEHNGVKHYRNEIHVDELNPLGRGSRDAEPAGEEPAQQIDDHYDNDQFDESDLDRHDA